MKNRFFNPFIGEKYQEGIKGKRVMVVGASFYCNHSELDCFRECTNVNVKDSSKFDYLCPVYKGDSKNLHDEPSYSIKNPLRTYTNFASYMQKVIGCERYEDVWDYLAFTNYVQFFLPSINGRFRETRISDLSERDFNAFNETLVELEPHIVVIWGCVFNSRIRESNEYLVSRETLDKTEWYVCNIKLPDIVHEITLINPYHPSSSAWFSKLDVFDKYFAMELAKK